MYHVFVTKQVVKETKKSGKLFKEKITAILHQLESDPRPNNTETLSGTLSFMYSYHFNFQGVAYRLVYQIDEEKKTVIALTVGPRENFYEKLRRKLG